MLWSPVLSDKSSCVTRIQSTLTYLSSVGIHKSSWNKFARFSLLLDVFTDQLFIENKKFIMITAININLNWHKLQKLLFVLIISRFLGLKLWKILRICVRSFVNSHTGSCCNLLCMFASHAYQFWSIHYGKCVS